MLDDQAKELAESICMIARNMAAQISIRNAVARAVPAVDIQLT